jgi:hypothetical protein
MDIFNKIADTAKNLIVDVAEASGGVANNIISVSKSVSSAAITVTNDVVQASSKAVQ